MAERVQHVHYELPSPRFDNVKRVSLPGMEKGRLSKIGHKSTTEIRSRSLEIARTIRWTEAGDRPLPDGKFTCPRSVIGGVIRYTMTLWIAFT
jgi:hypothetical protein